MARDAYHRQQIDRLECLTARVRTLPIWELQRVPGMLEAIGYTVHVLDKILAPHHPDTCVLEAHDGWHIQDRWGGRARSTTAVVWCTLRLEDPGAIRFSWLTLLLRLVREHRKGIRRREPYLRQRYRHLAVVS